MQSDLLGKWNIVATTLGFWRGKRDAAVEYTALPDGRWLDRLTWRKGASTKIHVLEGYDTWTGDECVWRGARALFWISSRWRFVRVASCGSWGVTWFSKATLGVTPAGMDVYSRSPDMPELDKVLSELQNDPALSVFTGWYRIGQG